MNAGCVVLFECFIVFVEVGWFFFYAIFIFIFWLPLKHDQYLSVGVNDIMFAKSSSFEAQTIQSASQQPEFSASVPAEDYVSVSPVHVFDPAEVIFKKVIEMITKTTTGYIYDLYVFILPVYKVRKYWKGLCCFVWVFLLSFRSLF